MSYCELGVWVGGRRDGLGGWVGGWVGGRRDIPIVEEELGIGDVPV